MEAWLQAAGVLLPGLVTVGIVWLGARLALQGSITAARTGRVLRGFRLPDPAGEHRDRGRGDAEPGQGRRRPGLHPAAPHPGRHPARPPPAAAARAAGC
ncbi:hypothetical protein R2F25_37460 [Streptomyces sp. UP1A-1]|nr:hypothetical protein [Streptomyces sp. UP1A-1]